MFSNIPASAIPKQGRNALKKKSMENQAYDICIVGGGIAGAALAGYLGNSGLRIAVVEKTLAEQDRIIGELLQPGGVEMLQKMGMEHLLDGFDAQPIHGYGLFMNGEDFRINYPKHEGKEVTGRGLRNGKFMQRLRQHATAHSNVTLIEGTATDIIEHNDTITGIVYKPKGADEPVQLSASLTVMSDGIFSAFRQGLSAADKKVSGHFLGLLLHHAQLPYANHGHVIITDNAPVLVYPVSSTETRVLIDFPGDVAPRKGEELSTFLNEVIGPQLPASIQATYYAAVQEGKFKVMPNHLMAAKPVMKNGGVLLGDSLNMRHPLTGGGMTVAFTDVYLLGSELLKTDFAKQENIYKAVKRFYKIRTEQTASINILADALYGVMRNNDLKMACFQYLKQGGNYAEQPVSILSAVSRDVNMLIRHFFAVAVFGMGKLLLPLPTPQRSKRAYRMLADAVNIISPLLKNEKVISVSRLTGQN